MRPIVRFFALVPVAVWAAACAPEVPEQPTWTEDVRPIVVANCIRCHSPPQQGGAPPFARFDKYDSEDRDGDGNAEILGAGAEASLMAARVLAEEMPPRSPLWKRQQDVIGAWADTGALEGPPIEGNRPPTMELGDFDADGDLLIADYQIDDPDFDLVTGRLTADPGGGVDPIVVTFDLFSGQSQIIWNVSSVPAGAYELSAEIEDGSADETVPLGSVEVP